MTRRRAIFWFALVPATAAVWTAVLMQAPPQTPAVDTIKAVEARATSFTLPAEERTLQTYTVCTIAGAENCWQVTFGSPPRPVCATAGCWRDGQRCLDGALCQRLRGD